jgi:hypothetical protein
MKGHSEHSWTIHRTWHSVSWKWILSVSDMFESCIIGMCVRVYCQHNTWLIRYNDIYRNVLYHLIYKVHIYIYIYALNIKCSLKKAIINNHKILEFSPIYGRGKVHTRTTQGSRRIDLLFLLTHCQMRMGGQRHAPAALTQERPNTHWRGGWVGPRLGPDGCGKSPPTGVSGHPVAGPYTDSAIPAHLPYYWVKYVVQSVGYRTYWCVSNAQKVHTIMITWTLFFFTGKLNHSLFVATLGKKCSPGSVTKWVHNAYILSSLFSASIKTIHSY